MRSFKPIVGYWYDILTIVQILKINCGLCHPSNHILDLKKVKKIQWFSQAATHILQRTTRLGINIRHLPDEASPLLYKVTCSITYFCFKSTTHQLLNSILLPFADAYEVWLQLFPVWYLLFLFPSTAREAAPS